MIDMGTEATYKPKYVVGAGYVGATNRGREVIEFYMNCIYHGARRFDSAHSYREI